MKIYTKTGDDGTTGRLGGGRVPKSHPQIEACGAVDELNCALGMALALGRLTDAHAARLARIQHELFALGAHLAGGSETLGAAAIERLERDIDELEADLPPLTQFILPGGSPSAALLHMARAVCRRAERRVHSWSQQGNVAGAASIYLNRLADLLFVLARSACLASGAPEVLWVR